MKLQNPSLRKRKGFTLIELIVVIAILAILAAIAIPSFLGVQGNANKRVILSNLKVIDSGIAVYAAENNVAKTAVTQTNLTTAPAIIESWPVGPKATTTYSVVNGVATVDLTAAIPGVAIGTYTATSAALTS